MSSRAGARPFFSWGGIALVGALALVACDRNEDDDGGDTPLLDPADGVIVAPPEDNPFGVTVIVLDQDSEAISDATVLVIDDAENGDLVPDEFETTLTIEGRSRLPLNAHEDGAVLRLEVERDGFFSNGGRFELATGEDTRVDIVLTSEETDLDGIRVTETAGDLSQGNLNAVATAADDPTRALTIVDVPQDLEVLDVDGVPLDDNLTLSVVHYDNRDETALAAFPGGFDVFIENIDEVDTPSIGGEVPMDGGDEEAGSNVIFQSIGFTAIEMFDSQGRKADRFEGAIDVTMAVPEGTINPSTGELVQVGDVIPVWSFDTDTARWVYEGTEAVAPDGRGGLQVTYQADHLSFWNLDFFDGARCNAGMNVSMVSADGQAVPEARVRITLRGADDNVGFFQRRSLDTGPILLAAVPASFPVSASFRSATPGVTVQGITRNGAAYTGQGFRACEGGNSFSVRADQTLAEIVGASAFDYSVTATAQCANSPETPPVALENVNVTYFSSDYESFVDARTSASGQARLAGQGNPSGTVFAFYDGVEQRRRVSGGTGAVSFQFSTDCVVVTGASGQ